MSKKSDSKIVLQLSFSNEYKYSHIYGRLRILDSSKYLPTAQCCQYGYIDYPSQYSSNGWMVDFRLSSQAGALTDDNGQQNWYALEAQFCDLRTIEFRELERNYKALKAYHAAMDRLEAKIGRHTDLATFFYYSAMALKVDYILFPNKPDAPSGWGFSAHDVDSRALDRLRWYSQECLKAAPLAESL